jgi:hypothetical protein
VYQGIDFNIILFDLRVRITILLDWISELQVIEKYLYTCMRITILLDWMSELIALEKYL